MVVLSAIDVEHRILPDRIVLPAAVIVLVAQIALYPEPSAGARARWSRVVAGFLFVALLVYPRGMGMGDVKLALLMGFMLGKEVAVAMMVALRSALLVSIVIFARQGIGARKQAIPFGPFLAFGCIVALFAGEWLLGRLPRPLLTLIRPEG